MDGDGRQSPTERVRRIDRKVRVQRPEHPDDDHGNATADKQGTGSQCRHAPHRYPFSRCPFSRRPAPGGLTHSITTRCTHLVCRTPGRFGAIKRTG